MKKRLTALFLAGMLLCGVLCGCRGSSGKNDPSAGDNGTSSGAETHGNEITVGIAQDLDSSLDPYSMTAAGTREVLFNVFEGLVKADPTGSFHAAVAEDYTISEDGRVYTFTLRNNVVFHNGKTMTLEDVLYSFETCAATTVDGTVGAALSSAAVTGKDGQLVITLEKANPDFLACLAYVYIVPSDYAEQATAPVGTGPFRFVSRSVQENVILEKHEKYYGTPAYLDKVTYRVFEDATAEVTALDAGSIDLAAHLTVDQIAGLDDSYQVLEGTMNLVQALYLNNDFEPFRDIRVRKAISYAIDVQAIMDLTADGHGTPVGSAMYPNFAKYFDPELAKLYPHDPEKAKQLLAEAGYPNGFTFTIKVPSNYTPHVRTAEVLIEQLSAVGITAKLNEIEWSTWLSDVYQGRNYEGTVVGFDASTLTASALLARYCSESPKNMFNYRSGEFDETYAKAGAETDDAASTALYKQCLQLLAEDAVNAYIQDLAEFTVIRSDLTGYEFYPFYVMDMSTIRYVK